MAACPVIKHNKIHLNKGSGIYVHTNGKGVVIENEIYENESSGVSVKSAANPVFQGNIIRDGKRTGIYVCEGKATLLENQVYNNAYRGIEISILGCIEENNVEYGNKKVPSDIEMAISRGDCTFSLAGQQHKTQDWYHCVTCNLVGNDGCCVSCARTCHEGHEIKYNKFGLFFCDCGDRLSNCKALKRAPPNVIYD